METTCLAASWLVFLASLDLALSLRCYACKEPTDLNNCWSVADCSEAATACKTTVHSVDSGYPFFGNITVSKGCSENCVPSEPDTIGENHPDFCCYTDLCNIGDGQPVMPRFPAPAIVAFAVLLVRF